MKIKGLLFSLALALFAGFIAVWQPARAAREELYTVDPKTIDLGKQGLYINDTPENVYFVEIEKIQPPLLPRYTYMVNIAYRGAVLDITFKTAAMAPITPIGTLTSVYFDISEPELKLWQTGGTEEIGIWYFDKRTTNWQLCPTRLIEEKQNNGKYDRLACFVIGNGFYLLGKMSIDKIFPERFRPYNLGNTTEPEMAGLLLR
ncbi:MAG TPA: hypothetical protein DEH25_03205 [Chloroflexi bacterium]|nr:hypothetical protein [Chloroflexota bacterium]HBY09448.1 hypothetical protein [Chloroflexota bacterium]